MTTTLVSSTTRTGFAKLGAHRLQFGFQFGRGDLDDRRIRAGAWPISVKRSDGGLA